MRLLKINDETEIRLYASVKELPIEVSKQFHAYILQDIGIGNDIESIDSHYSRLAVFIESDRKAEAIEEIKNLRFNLFSMLEKWDFRAMSFACLIQSVNGQPVTDTTLEGLDELIKRLSAAGLTGEMVSDLLADVKKNWIPNDSFISLNSLDLTSII